MSLNSFKLLIALTSVLLWSDSILIAAEVTAPIEEITPDEIIPTEVDPADSIEAGKAQHAFKKENPCEGMEKGDYLGPKVCNDCHQDKTKTILAGPHGQAADARSPFGRQGCETCHGPGMLHFDMKGNCIISMTGRYGESVEHRNEICLSCHKGGERMHWISSVHQAEGLVCLSCHSIHQPNDVIERSSQNNVCFSCHKDIRAQTFNASTHPIQDNKVVCSDCHNVHGSAGPSSLKQLSINENCYTCHAEKRGPFLWEHYPASEDCTLCHRVHGSNHRAMLNKPGPQLCQQCHSAVTRAGGLMHIGNFLDDGGSGAGQSRFIVGMNCANCHSKVHGSNHPSGAFLQR